MNTEPVHSQINSEKLRDFFIELKCAFEERFGCKLGGWFEQFK